MKNPIWSPISPGQLKRKSNKKNTQKRKSLYLNERKQTKLI